MSIISDAIEAFILSMFDEEGRAELQRNELAQYFSCSPSQINYVLTTRFNFDRGYIIESRRGGGGYIRIVRVNVNNESDHLYNLIINRIKEELTHNGVTDIVNQLFLQQIIDRRQALLLNAATSDAALADVPVELKNRARASIFKEMLKTYLKRY